MTSKLAKILGIAAITALTFGKPNLAYAPNIPIEMQEKYEKESYETLQKQERRKKEFEKYAKLLGKPLVDKWIQDAIDRIQPHDLIDVPYVLATMKQESKFDSLAKSWAGARGLMQVMPLTWKGLYKDNSFYTDAFNPDKNLEAGIRVLNGMAKFCERRYPEWDKLDDISKRELISAAYNGGNGTLQKKNWDINKMYSETRNYVPIIMENYKEFEEILE